MPLPESFKFDVRVRERLLRSGQLSDAEIQKRLDGLADVSANAATVELKQPAFQTEADRAEHAVVVRTVPPRPMVLAAPIDLDEEYDDEDDDDDEDEIVPAPRAPLAAVAPVSEEVAVEEKAVPPEAGGTGDAP